MSGTQITLTGVNGESIDVAVDRLAEELSQRDGYTEIVLFNYVPNGDREILHVKETPAVVLCRCVHKYLHREFHSLLIEGNILRDKMLNEHSKSLKYHAESIRLNAKSILCLSESIRTNTSALNSHSTAIKNLTIALCVVATIVAILAVEVYLQKRAIKAMTIPPSAAPTANADQRFDHQARSFAFFATARASSDVLFASDAIRFASCTSERVNSLISLDFLSSAILFPSSTRLCHWHFFLKPHRLLLKEN